MDIQQVSDLVGALVAIDSVNPDLVASGAGEQAIADFVAQWLTRAGLEVTFQNVAQGRPNVIAVARGTGGGRSLMFNAHMDTVGVAGMQNPFEPHIEDGRLYGRGAYDMKGSLAACMLTMAAVRSMNLAGDVIFTGVVDEEYASIGTQAIVREWHAHAAIVTEPTEMQLCVAHKGFVWLEVETIGKAAHGSRPDLGVDAIVKMGKILVGLDDLAAELQTGAHQHALLGSGSIHASLISGGQELSSYPERCNLKVERRTIPGEEPSFVESQIHDMIDHLNLDASFEVTVKTTLVRGAFEIAPHAPIVTTLRTQAEAVLSHKPDLVGATFWMDSALLSAAGIPTVVFGPGGTGAHAVVEWVDLAQVAQCVEIYTATAESFCGPRSS